MEENKITCQCDDLHVNEKVARANAFFTMFFMFVFILSSYAWIIFILLIDFFIKSFFHPKYGISSQIMGFFVNRVFKLKPKFIYAPPKIFASRLGLVFSVLIILFYYILNFQLVSFILALVLLLFSLLEGFFGFCMGCWFYSILGLAKGSIKK